MSPRVRPLTDDGRLAGPGGGSGRCAVVSGGGTAWRPGLAGPELVRRPLADQGAPLGGVVVGEQHVERRRWPDAGSGSP